MEHILRQRRNINIGEHNNNQWILPQSVVDDEQQDSKEKPFHSVAKTVSKIHFLILAMCIMVYFFYPKSNPKNRPDKILNTSVVLDNHQLIDDIILKKWTNREEATTAPNVTSSNKEKPKYETATNEDQLKSLLLSSNSSDIFFVRFYSVRYGGEIAQLEQSVWDVFSHVVTELNLPTKLVQVDCDSSCMSEGITLFNTINSYRLYMPAFLGNDTAGNKRLVVENFYFEEVVTTKHWSERLIKEMKKFLRETLKRNDLNVTLQTWTMQDIVKNKTKYEVVATRTVNAEDREHILGRNERRRISVVGNVTNEVDGKMLHSLLENQSLGGAVFVSYFFAQRHPPRNQYAGHRDFIALAADVEAADSDLPSFEMVRINCNYWDNRAREGCEGVDRYDKKFGDLDAAPRYYDGALFHLYISGDKKSPYRFIFNDGDNYVKEKAKAMVQAVDDRLKKAVAAAAGRKILCWHPLAKQKTVPCYLYPVQKWANARLSR